MADLILTDSQAVNVVASFTDKKGKKAKIDGVPEWTCSNPAALAMTVAPDGMSADFVAGELADDVQISCSADADLGAGVTPLVVTGSISVVAGAAVAGTFAFGAPTEQP